MMLNLYTIKDELTEYAPPVTIQTDELAKRYFREITKENKMMSNNPEDFSIWYIGNYDTEDGTIEPCRPKLIERAKSNGQNTKKTN